MNTSIEIFPKALVTAARTFANRPAVVGEVLVALVTGQTTAKMDDVRKYIVEECRMEIAERQAVRERAADRKRRNRDNAKKGTK